MKLGVRGLAFVLAGLLVLAGLALARSKSRDNDDFPDYNRLEYTKELPPPDKQLTDPGPGSIHMRVGEKAPETKGTPLEQLPMAIRPASKADTGEPPMDFMEAGSPTPIPTASSSTVKPSELAQ